MLFRSITNLFSAADGRIWFGTTYGDIYRSIDGGNNWTKTATGFPPYNTGTAEQDISDIAFSDSLHGIAVQVDAATPAVLLKQTSDGGLTWVDVIPTGTFYPNESEARVKQKVEEGRFLTSSNGLLVQLWIQRVHHVNVETAHSHET